MWIDPYLLQPGAQALASAEELVPPVKDASGGSDRAESSVELLPPAEETGDGYRPATACSVGFDYAVISAFGDVTPCCYSDEILGNLREQTFREIWKGALYKQFRTRLIHGEFAPYCADFRCAIEDVLRH